MATYPGGIVSLTNPTAADSMATVNHAAQHSTANDEIEAIETELGTNPKGSSASVASRLSTLAPIASPTFTGTATTATLNSVVVINGTNYAKTSAGLQAALDGNGPGTTFWLTDGTYDITAQVNSWNADVTILGSRNAILKRHNSSSGYSILVLNGARSRASGFTIDGNKANQAGTDTWANLAIESTAVNSSVDNLKIINSYAAALVVEGAGSRVSDIHFEDNYAATMTGGYQAALEIDAECSVNNIYIDNSPIGIAIVGGVQVNISNVDMYNITKDQGSGIHGYDTSYVNISNVNLYSTALTAHGTNGIFLASSSGSLNANLSNINMYDVSGVGIELQDNYANLSNIHIELRNGGGGTSTDQQGMFIGTGVTNVNVNNFYISGSKINGLSIGYDAGNCSKLRFSNGTIVDSGAAGVAFDHTSNNVSDVAFENVSISGSGTYGMWSAASTPVSDIQLLNVTFATNSSGNLDATVTAGLSPFSGTAKGDLITFSSVATPSVVSIGTAGQVLTVGTGGTAVWSAAASTAGNIAASVGTAKGDILAFSAASTATTIAIGTAGQVLTVGTGGTAIWSAAASTAGNIAASVGTAKGDILAFSAASTATTIAIGTAGQVLTVGTGGTAVWETHAAAAAVTRATFGSAAVSSTGTITITHSLSLSAPYSLILFLYDSGGQQVIPDSITNTAGTATVSIVSYGTISGTWGYVYMAG